MSELSIGLVAEGTTDQIVIEAALNAILPEPFVLTLLQPEATRSELGGGWCGVLKWEYKPRLESDFQPPNERMRLHCVRLLKRCG